MLFLAYILTAFKQHIEFHNIKQKSNWNHNTKQKSNWNHNIKQKSNWNHNIKQKSNWNHSTNNMEFCTKRNFHGDAKVYLKTYFVNYVH